MCADCSNPQCSRLTEQWFDMADVHCMSEGSVENGRVLSFDMKLPFVPTEDQKSKIGMVRNASLIFPNVVALALRSTWLLDVRACFPGTPW